ncbi:DUF2157 domain-containing protein [Pseudomonas sp. F1_0610]|uniref:DUF2157 domain-containing protein n=1 Tax=Pseudomonas sp. F1_0610 TaxID=3114284 RepID=UPI0039C1E10C
MSSDAQQLVQWVENGVIPAKHLEQALHEAQAFPNTAQGIQFLQRLLLTFGVLFLCSGIIFFFAYNWAELTRFEKFAIAQAVLALSLLALAFAQLHSLVGQAIIFAIGLILGANLALFGQTYQTGADPYQLFLTWALMLMPLSALARSATLWLCSALLLALASHLYLVVYSFNQFLINDEQVEFWVLFIQSLAWLLAFGYASKRNPNSATLRLICQTFSFFCMFCATYLLCSEIISYNYDAHYIFTVVVWTAMLATMYYIYRVRSINLFILSSFTLSISVVIFTIVADLIHDFDALSFFIYALLIIALSSSALIWLRKVAREVRHA